MTTNTPQSWFDRTRRLALTLTNWPSISGTAGEMAFGPQLLDLARQWPYFQAFPDDAWTSLAAYSAASNVYLLVRGQGPQTVVLSGHYDTVSTEGYGELQPLALDPEALTPALIASLERSATDVAQKQALEDLRGGDFLAGRGLLDMKSGLAAGLAVLERYAALPEAQRPGHLLLIASPDEEVLSRGARSAATELPRCARQRGLQLSLGINLDATSDLTDGQEGRAAYLGTVGKVPVWALVLGRPTHAAYPFDGVSAALIAATLLAEVEGNPALSDHAHGESAPPPVCLEWQSLRSGYDVTTPAAVWAAFNVLTHQRTPGEVLQQFSDLAAAVMTRGLGQWAARAEQWGSAAEAALHPAVLSYAELRERAVERAGEQALIALEQATPAQPDPLAATRQIVQTLVRWAEVPGPAVVLGLGSVHYPQTHTSQSDPSGNTERWLRAELAGAPGESVTVRPFFAGISDMSSIGHSADTDDAVRRQTVHPAHLNSPAAQTLGFPTVNIGPWGRDYHQRLERVYQPYAFGELPALLWRLTCARLTSAVR